jgi:uncharacterized protein Veg
MNDINIFFNNIIVNYQKQIIKEYPTVEISKLQKIWENMDYKKGGGKKKELKKKGKKKTAYQNFFVIMRKQVTSENSNIKFGEISKIISSRWNALNPEEKKKYEVNDEVNNELKTDYQNLSSNPYINLFEDDEKSKNELNRCGYEHDDDDIDDALSEMDDEDENIDELNFDDVMG